MTDSTISAWMVLAIVNTSFSALFALNAVAERHSILPAVPNGVVAIVFWYLVVMA